MNGGTDGYVPSPKQNPRLRPEGESFAERNRKGCGEKWYDYTPSDEASENQPPPHDRMPTEEARKNAELNKGSISDIFGGYCDTPTRYQIHPRSITAESQVTADANRGDSMRHIMENYGDGTPDPPPVQKLKGEFAVEYAERNKGSSNHIINNYGVRTPTNDEVKVKMDHITRQNKQDSVTGILQMNPPSPTHVDTRTHQGKLHARSEESWDELPPNRHCRPEGEEISRHMNNHMGDILSMKPSDTPKQEKVVKELPHMQEASTPRPGTASRVRPEGQGNYDRDHSSSSMKGIFSSEPADSSHQNVKVNRMMLRSENW